MQDAGSNKSFVNSCSVFSPLSLNIYKPRVKEDVTRHAEACGGIDIRSVCMCESGILKLNVDLGHRITCGLNVE